MAYPVHSYTSEAPLKTILRNAKPLWPFLAGFATTGYIMFKVAMTVTDEDVKASKFANPKGAH